MMCYYLNVHFQGQRVKHVALKAYRGIAARIVKFRNG